MPAKIVIIGPESTGKSTLCAQLADHYHSLWCPEFAREYLSIHGMEYSYGDLLTIAEGQVSLEQQYISKQGELPLFIDTDMYVMKVWCEFVYGKCHQYILDQIDTRQYDLYLLCNIDLEWTFDELREYPDLESRQRLFEIYKNILLNQSTPWAVISGTSDERKAAAVEAVDSLLKT